LSCLSIFRVFPTIVAPKLDTITAPFNGSTRTLNGSLLKAALKDLFGNRLYRHFHLESPRLLQIERSSPNTKKAT
jgi:hypothetical protein